MTPLPHRLLFNLFLGNNLHFASLLEPSLSLRNHGSIVHSLFPTSWSASYSVCLSPFSANDCLSVFGLVLRMLPVYVSKFLSSPSLFFLWSSFVVVVGGPVSFKVKYKRGGWRRSSWEHVKVFIIMRLWRVSRSFAVVVVGLGVLRWWGWSLQDLIILSSLVRARPLVGTWPFFIVRARREKKGKGVECLLVMVSGRSFLSRSLLS